MTPLRRYSLLLALFTLMAGIWVSRTRPAHAQSTATPLEPGFAQVVKPFLQQNCARCHNADVMLSGVRVDHLDSSLDDKHVRLWEAIRHRVSDGSMPPKGQKQPTAEQRAQVADWISQGLTVARMRPTPKNGVVRRLTVAQYRNTLRELLQLDDDMTDIVPPDAVSSDGFVNNKETLQLSPLLLESYFEVAEQALNRSIVDPAVKPKIQNFRVELGNSINPAPLPEELILGANSLLLDNKDVLVTEPRPVKPFPFDHYRMRTNYRFIEGYQGNDTVRGWREYSSIYHSVFACMRGSNGYPKGAAYSTVPSGLLLRPAIPNDETFTADGTYGPKANFKISLRELPDHGRFRVTVTAAKYNDGLLLDPGAKARPVANAITLDPNAARQTVTIKQPGIYQVDLYAATPRATPVPPDASRLNEGLVGAYTFEGGAPGRMEGDAKLAASPFGQAVTLDGKDDAVAIPHQAGMDFGKGDFTISAWVDPTELRRAGILSLGARGSKQGWYLEMPDNRGSLRFGSASGSQPITSGPGVLRVNTWQHIAVVVGRARNQTRLFVNGFPVAKGTVGDLNLDNPQSELLLGRLPNAQQWRGDLDEVRLYRRALGEAELQALLEPGRQFVKAPPDGRPQDVTLTLGDREFIGKLPQPAFVIVRLPAGPLAVRAEHAGVKEFDRMVLTPLESTDDVAKRFVAFEKRVPKLGVHLGLRRDCGSTFAQVGTAQEVTNNQLTRYVYSGAIRNFPSPDVEKDNVNYLAGVREIAVRSEYTDGRDMPRLLVRAVEFEGPFYESWPPPTHRNIFIDSPQKTNPPAYARQVIRTFATRAYRRPVTATEEATLFAVFDKAFARTKNFQQSVKDALLVVLTSPQFLFLTENSATPQPEQLTEHELASKLSYFLWNGPPDRTTLGLANTGKLRPQLDSEVTRLLQSPRAELFIREFTNQWLSLDKFAVLEPDRKRFPKLNRDTRSHLKQEPIQFVQYLIRQNLPVRNLIASDFMLANEVVASYYELGEKTESGLQFVPIAHQRRELGGVLTQAALMAGLSDGRESNPVKRGAWLARKIIAEPPPAPPPNVPALKESENGLTLRQRIEQHRSQPGCMQCHSTIDPWGVALEEFDAGGRLKKQPTDARSKLPDATEVAGIDDLKRYLSQDRIDQVAFSVLKHLATYSTGRTLTYKELHDLKQESAKLKATGYRMQDMIRFVVSSKMFLEK